MSSPSYSPISPSYSPISPSYSLDFISSDDKRKSIEVISIYNDNTNTWDFTTTFNHIEYKSENVIFNPQINSFKKVSKLLDMCKDDITHIIENNIIIITIKVDFIDDEKIILKLEKNMMSYEELEMKYISLSQEISEKEDIYDMFIMMLIRTKSCTYSCEKQCRRCLKKHLSTILKSFDNNRYLSYDSKWIDRLREYISEYE